MPALTPEQVAFYKAHSGDDLRPNETASLVCGLLAAIVAIGARITARRISRVQLGPEDWTIFAAMVRDLHLLRREAFEILTFLQLGEITYAVIFAKAINNGQGRHIIFIKDLVSFSKGYVAAIVSYSYTVMVTKISILIFYRRLFRSRWLMACSWIIGIIVVMYNLAVILIAGLQCIPLSDLWTGGLSCINTEPPFTGLAIVNIFTDVAILTLPVKPVLNLHMPKTQKVQVLGIFLLGGVVCVFGIIRAVAMTRLSLVDPTWTAVGAAIWSFVEISVGIVAACLPLLGPLIRTKSTASPNWSGNDGQAPSVEYSAARPNKTNYVRQDEIPLVTVAGHDRSSLIQGGVPVLPWSSKQCTNQILVQNDIQHTVTLA
ncbi:hypothetical protein BO79DRAFT_253672 [Aspergillus costaricaensis CBS 115574]|uniref:Uncharacterized protein n=1 Tax=Aspergillus costaricaensis CBS 115574 TaxID=1448317 RepID=A0ACD1IIT9_9EURO|nr:hypothetical protein BO79DRAFT_253672 [Aspergillus costaricaensis CBS 115574]RAK90255.1 hypothetical protein BO79DRAFT_253672 [Aspergillus costaricaensis CBS 115574]